MLHVSDDVESPETRARPGWRLSVIMPAYNAAGTLREQIEALLAQDYRGEWEILVVDNHSTDETADIVRQYQRTVPHLRLVPAHERQGRSYACNVGARAASGQALIFCDADDVVAPGWLRALAGALARHEFVASTIEVEELNRDLAWHPRPPNWATQRNLGFLPFAGGALMAVARAAFEAVGGFDEAAPFCEDVDLSWRLQLNGYSLYNEPQAITHVRYRGTDKAMWTQQVRFAQAHVYLYKHYRAEGMPRSSWRDVWPKYVKLAKTVGRLWSQDARARLLWIQEAGVCWGHFTGSLRYGVLYL